MTAIPAHLRWCTKMQRRSWLITIRWPPVWLGRPMPDEYVEFGRSWERLHPGWQVITWGDDDLDWLANRAEFDRAERFTTKANIARYEIIHREGGLYVDCDFEALRPIDELLEGASIVVGEDRDGMLNDAFFAGQCGPSRARLRDRRTTPFVRGPVPRSLG